jgi:hypothetical protein
MEENDLSMIAKRWTSADGSGTAWENSRKEHRVAAKEVALSKPKIGLPWAASTPETGNVIYAKLTPPSPPPPQPQQHNKKNNNNNNNCDPRTIFIARRELPHPRF